MGTDVLRNINKPIFYVTHDVGWGIGLENVLPNYHIVCLDDHPLVDILTKSGVSVFCLERVLGKKNILRRSSGIILDHPAVLDFIKEKSEGERPNILFFKPQRKIELVAKKNKFNLLGNQVGRSRLFEDKLSFFKLCQENKIKLPEGEIKRLSEIKFADMAKKYGEPLVIQFGRGWAGNTTFFIKSEDEFSKLQKKFGQMEVKMSKFIKGRTVLNNAVIFQKQIFVSQPALQIKADKLLTATQAGTGGRRWPSGLGREEKEEISKITFSVGSLMAKLGYQGFFGLDFLLDHSSGEIFVSENNARLTASVPFYTKLELGAGGFPLLGFHLLAFLPQVKLPKIDFSPSDISGSEIVVRNTQDVAVKIGSSLPTGIYDENCLFVRESAFLDVLESDVFWLKTVAPGRAVNPEIEIAKIETLASVCDDEGRLTEKAKKVVEWVKSNLKFSHG